MTLVAKVKMKPNWANSTQSSLERGMSELVVDIDKRAKILTPIDTGNLVNSQRIKRLSAFAWSITSGGSRAPYGRRQYYENKTKSHWLEKAADSVTRGNTAKYFKNKGL